jgi:hypothetical protein
LTFLMFVRPKFILTLDCISIPFLLVAYAYAIPRYGALGAAWVTSAGRVFKGLLAQIAAARWAAQPSLAGMKTGLSSTRREAFYAGGI